MVRNDTDSAFSVEWLGIAFMAGLTLQLLGWLVGVGILTGLPAYFLVGLLTAWGSPGNTLAEPAIAAFLIAIIGFVVDNIFLTILVVGIPIAVTYGVVGLLVALLGAYLGERFLDTA
jgi:hypothetical protein